MVSSAFSSVACLLSFVPSYSDDSIRWNASMNSLFHFLQVSRYMSRLSLTDSYTPVSTFQMTFFISSDNGGVRCSDANSMAFSRFDVWRM